MKNVIKIAAIMLALVLAGHYAQAAEPSQENRGSGNYMLPLCKTWLHMSSNDLTAIKDELKAGAASPGGIPMHMIEAGMCAGIVIGISEMLNGTAACLPTGVTNEQLVRVAVASVEKNPAHMHEDFSVLAGAAIALAWPCHK
jgi:Ssp1 endopeptidase immunity protein Rap1a